MKNNRFVLVLELLSVTFIIYMAVLIAGCNASKERIKVLSIAKDDWGAEEPAECRNWFPSGEDIERIVAISRKMNTMEAHVMYCWVPCEMEGELIYYDQRYGYTLNAAYQLALYNSDTSFVFGCESEECHEYFIPIVNGSKVFPPSCDPSDPPDD